MPRTALHCTVRLCYAMLYLDDNINRNGNKGFLSRYLINYQLSKSRSKSKNVRTCVLGEVR